LPAYRRHTDLLHTPAPHTRSSPLSARLFSPLPRPYLLHVRSKALLHLPPETTLVPAFTCGQANPGPFFTCMCMHTLGASSDELIGIKSISRDAGDGPKNSLALSIRKALLGTKSTWMLTIDIASSDPCRFSNKEACCEYAPHKEDCSHCRALQPARGQVKRCFQSA